MFSALLAPTSVFFLSSMATVLIKFSTGECQKNLIIKKITKAGIVEQGLCRNVSYIWLQEKRSIIDKEPY